MDRSMAGVEGPIYMDYGPCIAAYHVMTGSVQVIATQYESHCQLLILFGRSTSDTQVTHAE